MKIPRYILIIIVIVVYGTSCTSSNHIQKPADTIPPLIKGQFSDDYHIGYNISDTLWIQLPNVKYHILSCDTTAQYLLARNDDHNPSEPGLYTRIDYIRFNNMKPFEWGFCLTVFDAKTMEEAKLKTTADRQNPKTGCNGFPFSRMKIRD